jgi:putative oxidoreductase
MNYDLALLILRVVTGLTLAAHGSQKLFGWFGGGGFKGTVGMTTRMRMRPATFWAVMVIMGEFAASLLLVLGLLSPLGSLGVIAAMLVAIISAHWPRFFSTNHGSEFPLLILVNALAIGISGPGAYSLDALIGLSLPEPATLLVGLALVIVATVVVFTTRTPQEVAAADPALTNQARS